MYSKKNNADFYYKVIIQRYMYYIDVLIINANFISRFYTKCMWM